MKIQQPLASGLLIIATVGIAAGLSYNVLSLGDSASGAEVEAAAGGSIQAEDPREPVESSLTSSATSLESDTSSSTAPTASAAPATSSTPTPAPTAAPSPTSAPTPTAAPTIQFETVSLARVGSVVVAIHENSTLEFWSAEPAAGWAYKVEDVERTSFEIEFHSKSGEDEAEFKIRLSNGSVRVSEDD